MCLTEIYSKVNEFRESDKYCDITVEVQEKSFNCHRLLLAAASEYFDVMFGGKFSESKANKIVLKDIDALSFEQILCYIYTGRISLTRENVFGVLRASGFFHIVCVEEWCIYFIQNNLSLVDEMLNVFKYANLIDKKSLIACTARYVMEHFDEFDHDRLFLELSARDLQMLIGHRWYLSVIYEGPFLKTVFRWVNHTWPSDVHTRELEEESKNENLPEESAKSILIKLAREMRLPEASESIDYADFNVLIGKPTLELHVYLKSFNDERIRVLSLSRSMPQGTVSCLFGPPHILYGLKKLTVAGVGDYLFCLSTHTDSPHSRFRASPLVDFSNELSGFRWLHPPPTTGKGGIGICSIQNKIYLNSEGQFLDGGDSLEDCYNVNESPLNSLGASSKRIYLYNTHSDKWFRGPDPEVNPTCSTIVTYNDVLYLVGCGGLLQALDYRTSRWQKLSMAGSLCTHELEKTCSCVHDGKIYVCQPPSYDNLSNVAMRRYDVIASKWENITPTNGLKVSRKLLSYESLLWAFGRCECGWIIETYNALVEEWSPVSIPYQVPVETPGNLIKTYDGVVFKPVWKY